MNLQTELSEFGFAYQRNAVDAEQLDILLNLFHPASEQAGVRKRGGRAYAARNVLWENPGLDATLVELGLNQIATEALGKEAFPISATFFDKNADANWKVPGHQDLMMPVECETTESGFCGWSMKLGVVYVEPPTEVLENLVALRIHLDDCPLSNGPLAVIPGSHRHGKLRDADMTALSSEQFTACTAARGDVLLMNPLLVHRSSTAAVPLCRRVLHVVFATEEPGTIVRWKRAASG